MDGIGGEVSHKIRSAIKAKLMELGAYADDELPDYIMVMVANKRSRQQMEEDLQLFLGENTVTFTAWLHTVLNKLQQVSIANLESKKAMDAERKKRPSTEEHKKEKKKKARKEKDKDKGKDEKSDERDERVKNRNEERKKWKVNEEKTESSEHKTHMKEHVQELKSSEPVVTVASSAVKQGEKKMTDDEDEDFLNLKADIEADLWGDGENEEMPQARTKFAKSSQLDPGKITVSSYADPSKLATLQAEVVESTKPPATLPNNSLPTAGNLEPIPSSGKALLEKVENSSPVKGSERPQPRIIKISETLRQEQETIHPSIKRAAEPQNEKGMKITHSPVRYKSQESEAKEDDAEIFGRHIAHELRQLTQRQRNLAKLKIQQRLASQDSVRQVQKRVEPMSERKGDQRSGVPRSQAQHVDRRSERGLNRQDLRLTLRRDKNPDRSRERVHIRDRERDRERERGRERERERDRDHKIDIERKQTGVSSVVRTKPPEDEEQPDTSIASVVRVKPRPRIPAAIQANRNLILKAVAEAQKSVSKAPVRSLPVERLAEDKTQSFSSSHPGVKVPKTPKVQRMFILQKNEGRLPAREDLQKMSITVGGNLITGEANSKIQNDSNDGSEEIENSIPLDSPLNLLIEVPTSPVVTESTNPQDTSQTEKVLRWIEDVEEATKSMDDPLHTSQDISLDGVMVRENAQQSEADEDGGMEIESETGNIRLDVDDEQDMDITLGPDMDDIETGMGMEESGAVHSGKARQEQQLNSTWSSGTGPQFVVTLDGLDPKLLRSFAVGDANMELPKRQQVVYPQQQQENTAEEHTHHDQQEQQEQQLRQELLKQQAIAKERQLEKHKASVRPTIAVPPAVSLPENTGRVLGKRPASPIRVSEGPPLKVMAKVSSLERCKYWPACKLKEKCEYHHPSGPCKLFPNCKFADRCLYIHPKCRYDTGCVRRHCQYSHTSSRPTPSTGIVGTQPIQQACKFFPNCNNPSCPFIHPKVCRFGTYCTTLNCQFIHDDRYVPTKHKWIRH